MHMANICVLYLLSDTHQFWRQLFCCRSTISLEQSAAQSQTMWAGIQPVQVVYKDIFILTVRPRRRVMCFYLLIP